MRGLNQSLLEVLQAETAKDPFSDLETVLDVALKNYSRHIKTIKAAQVATIATSNPTPVAAPSPPAGGFLFGGKSLPTSGTSTPALNPEAPAFIQVKSPSVFPAFIPPGSGAKTTPEDKSPADDGESTDKSKDTQPTAAALPSSFDSIAKSAAITDTQMEGSSFGKESTKEALESTSTVKVSPFKPSVFGSGVFGAPSAFGGPPALSFGAFATDNDKGGEKESPKFGAPKSTFSTNAFGSAISTSFGDLPTSVTSVGFSFGSSIVGAKKDDTSSTAQAERAPTGPATTGPAVSAFGGATSGSNAKPVFGISAFGAPAKSVFGSSSGTSLFGGGGAFGPSSAAKLGEGSTTPTSPFGTASGFGGFGGGPSVFGAQSTPAPAAPEASGELQETEAEFPPATFEFASTDIEGAGEEDETPVYTVRGKLLKLVEGKWNPLGLGYFKIKKHKETGKHRVLFRTEGNGHVVAVRISPFPSSGACADAQILSQNFNIFAGMALTKQAKLLRFPGMEGSQLVPFGLQLKLSVMVDETYDAMSKASSEVNPT